MKENKAFPDKQGMVVKQYIGENDSEYLVIKHKVGNSMDESEYRKYFDELKADGVFLNDSYDDEKWICFKDSDSATVSMVFPFTELPQINNTIKNFILIKLYVQKCTLTTAKKRLIHIRHFMHDTGFMNPDNVKDYQMLLKTWSESRKREAISVREFLDFCSLENAGLYFDVLKNIIKVENNFRNLPDIKGILIFDYIVNDYWNNIQQSEDKYRLFPIILWWKLTTVIPTRPIELFHIKRNCVYEENSRYYLKLERQKTELDKELVMSDIVTDFEINEELYFLIKDYADYCEQIDNCKYLLAPPTCDMIYRGRVLNKREKFTNKKMDIYYKAFQKEVVEGQYGYKVVKTYDIKEGEIPYIHYGDTRHLAILNMMQQGVNPVYIAKLAGHHTLDAQMGYYSHLETFTTAKTYMLNQFMKNNHHLKRNMTEEDVGKTGSIIKKSLLGADYYSLPKVLNGQGRCSSKNIPYECSHKSCIFCKYFFPEHMTEDYLEYCRKENDRDLNMIRKELKELFGQVSLRDDIALQQDALKLGALLNQKIMIDSYTYKGGD